MACKDCVTGTLHEGTPAGEEIKLGGLSTYATGDKSSQRIVVFGSDIFGWKFINTRLLADEYASRGFRVLLPDLFDGYELPQWTLSARDPVNETPTLMERVVNRPLSLFVMILFLIRNSYSSQSGKITTFTTHLREAYPSAKVGFVGFCWGGRYSISLNGIFDATVAAHPSLVKYPAELDGVSKPISFALAASDHNFDTARGKDAEKRIRDKGVSDVEVVTYENVMHGWTVRGNLKDEQKKAARDRAIEQSVNWFEKYLS